jgi:phosphoenolpyruvate phosphomutase
MQQSKAAAFRKRFLTAKKPLIIVGAHDGLGAQLIEKHGFDGVWASGLEISASHGVPDANILTMTQYLERAQEMNMNSGIPVICDVDTGYGNSSNVHYMVQQYEAAGIAGIVIEDKLFPKVNSFMPGRQELASIIEFCGKLEAAQAAKQTEGFLVIARVEALIAGWGHDEALKRAEAYRKAGADAILIHSKSTQPDEIRAFLKAWKKRGPIVLVPTTYPDMTYDEMAKSGVNMIIYANQCLRASITAMHNTLETMQREKSTVSLEKNIATVKEIFELQGMMAMKEHEKKYLRMGKAVKVIVPAAGAPNHEGSMASLLKKQPVTMLDIEGKPLLHRIIDNLHLAGLQNDITVMTGYKGEMVGGPTAKLQTVSDWQKKGLLSTLLQAPNAFHCPTLIHYGDIIVSHENLRALIDSEAPITIAVSPIQREGRYEKKKFDFVSFTKKAGQKRSLAPHPQNTLKAIGDLPQDQIHGEFVGLVFLNQKGADEAKKQIAALSKKDRDTMSLTEFLHQLSKKTEIRTFEMRTGWAEVHSGDDLEQLRALFRTA